MEKVNSRNIFVVHGRKLKIRDSMFEFLRELKLFPLEWSKAVTFTGKRTLYKNQQTLLSIEG